MCSEALTRARFVSDERKLTPLVVLFDPERMDFHLTTGRISFV
jgi:hypothetical protein